VDLAALGAGAVDQLRRVMCGRHDLVVVRVPLAARMAHQESTGEVVALASLIRSASRDSAEPAVLVEDAWQRQGIGRRAVTRLIAPRLPGHLSHRSAGGTRLLGQSSAVGARSGCGFPGG
jgi:GNAT superfamily N-acetyltransferase